MREFIADISYGFKILGGGLLSGVSVAALHHWASTSDILNLAPKVLSFPHETARNFTKVGESAAKIPTWEMFALGGLGFALIYTVLKGFKLFSRLDLLNYRGQI